MAFLTDGGQTAASVAELVGGFLDEARQTIDIAIYDLRLAGEAADRLSRSVAAARARGVAIRVVFNVDHQRAAPEPPPPAVDWDLLKSWDVPFHPISGVPDLMHHKYVVLDSGTPNAALLTGSSNWTTDSWTREENLLVRLRSPALTAVYEQNFEELWTKRHVAVSGHERPVWVELASDLSARAYFTPGRAEKLVHEIAQAAATARRRIRICSPVITSGPILGSLNEVVAAGRVDVRGVYDATQMAAVEAQWRERAASAWKLAAFGALIAGAPFGAKVSTPWQKGSVHDFMHAKALVADDTVFTGSYNLSHSGEENAENVVEIHHPGLADMVAGFIERIAARYRVAKTYPAPG